MITLEEACKKAQNVFAQKKYKKGIVEAYDIGDRWLFCGIIFGDGSPEYGNTPITISKETGKFEEFPLNEIENLKIYYNAKEILIPEKFLYKG